LSRNLIPLSEHEWRSIESAILFNPKGVRKSTKGSVNIPLSTEFILAVKLARFSGLRRSEILTLRERQIYRPTAEQLNKKYLIHAEGLYLAPSMGVNTKGGTSRYAEIPTFLMLELHSYINSSRYMERKRKFISLNPIEANNPFLFITSLGNKFSDNTINARWGELRNEIQNQHDDFNHKFHNLRATYAVFRLKELLNYKLKEEDALDYLQSTLGHQHRITLLAYLRFCEQENCANATYEDALDIILER
nr:site-specific integrase [Vibrio anguillarum]